jgi:hypothetical protein
MALGLDDVHRVALLAGLLWLLAPAARLLAVFNTIFRFIY